MTTFSIALDALKEGNTIKRKYKNHYLYMTTAPFLYQERDRDPSMELNTIINVNLVTQTMYIFTPTVEDILAEDWIINKFKPNGENK